MNTPSKADRDQANRWLTESQDRLSLLREVLNGYDRLSDRMESRDRENRHLRAENEQLRHRTETLEGECALLLARELQLQAEIGRAQQAREDVVDRIAAVGSELVALLRRTAATTTRTLVPDLWPRNSGLGKFVDLIGVLQKVLQPTPGT
jgi:chromosome segregation ATPase